MNGLSKALAEALSSPASLAAASIELGIVVSTDPLIINFRGVNLSDGVLVSKNITLTNNTTVIIANFGANQKIIIGVI